MTYAEDKRHQEIVKRVVNKAIKMGRKPENISISGIQNPDLKKWAERKGVRFDPNQEVDIFEDEKSGVPPLRKAIARLAKT